MYNEKKLQMIENRLVAQFSNIFLRVYQENRNIDFPSRVVKQLEKNNQELINLAKHDAVNYIGIYYYKNILSAAEDNESEELTALMIAYFLVVYKNIQKSINEYSIINNITKIEAFNMIGNNKLQSYTRTVINDIYNQLLLKTYQQAGVEYFRFVAVLDSRTSDICKFMNGKILTTNNVSQFRPPLHPFCRSRLVPIKTENVTRKNTFTAMPENLTNTFNWFKSTYALDIDALQISLNNINVKV